MDDLTCELKNLLLENGAVLIGFADLRRIVKDTENAEMPFGVSVGLNIPAEVIKSIHDGPNLAYYDAYHSLNEKLNELVILGKNFLEARGYKAFAQTTDVVKEFGVYRTILPHKTVATQAGLGWIGKSALFVSNKYGPAVRISSLITNAELKCGIPILASRCGNCMICTNACPGQAISGKLWYREMDRNEFFNPLACRKKARKLAAERINKEITLCGKCIEVCPYTQNYLITASIDAGAI